MTPGTVVTFKSAKGYNLRAVVLDYLPLPGELIPIRRIGRSAACAGDKVTVVSYVASSDLTIAKENIPARNKDQTLLNL